MLPWQPFLAFYIWGAHWRHLKNTTEPSICGGDAAFCQITLTTCYYIIQTKVIFYSVFTTDYLIFIHGCMAMVNLALYTARSSRLSDNNFIVEITSSKVLISLQVFLK